MPPEQYRGRSIQIYFDTDRECKEILNAAEKARISMAAFCREMIRKGMAEPPASPALLEAQEALFAARKELDRRAGEIRRLESEIFSLRGSMLAQEEAAANVDSGLVALLQDGQFHRSTDIMRSLKIDSNNMDAIRSLAAQLHALQDLQLVSEDPQGWKWVG